MVIIYGDKRHDIYIFLGKLGKLVGYSLFLETIEWGAAQSLATIVGGNLEELAFRLWSPPRQHVFVITFGA
jgi:hypothetical protein